MTLEFIAVPLQGQYNAARELLEEAKKSAKVFLSYFLSYHYSFLPYCSLKCCEETM